MLGKRILADLIDFFAITTTFTSLSFIGMFYWDFKGMPTFMYDIFLFFCIFIIIIKDIVGGKSIGKRIMKVEVVSTSSSKLNIGRLMLRNVTFIIWPIEAIVLLSTRKRIGDIIAKTDVTYSK
jgi:uncharacterized RDD family membrane protein YckC